MIIKERKSNILYSNVVLFFNKHFTFGRLILFSIAIFILITTSLVSMYYGMKVYQSGKAGSLNYKIHDFAVSKLSFIPNYFQGLFSKPDEFTIDIKFKDLEKIRHYRKKSLDIGYVLPEGKDDDVPARLTYNGKTYKINEIETDEY